VSDEEWALVAPYLTLLPAEISQREPSLGEVFDGARYIVKAGGPWAGSPTIYRRARQPHLALQP